MFFLKFQGYLDDFRREKQFIHQRYVHTILKTLLLSICLHGLSYRVDKSIVIVTRMPEVLAKIKPTESSRLVKCEARKKRNCSDSSGNSLVKILYQRQKTL